MVLTFNRQVHILQDFTSDRERLGKRPHHAAAESGARRCTTRPSRPSGEWPRPPRRARRSSSSRTASTPRAAPRFDNLRELARRSEVPVFSLGLDSGTEAIHNACAGPGAGGGGGHGRPGGGGAVVAVVVAEGAGGGGFRVEGSAGDGRGGRGQIEGFDAKPLQELADETGGRAEIIKGLEHYTPGEELPGGRSAQEGRRVHRLDPAPSVPASATSLPTGRPDWRTIRVEVDRPEGARRDRARATSPRSDLTISRRVFAVARLSG